MLCVCALCSGVSGPFTDGRLRAVLRNRARVSFHAMDSTRSPGSLRLFVVCPLTAVIVKHDVQDVMSPSALDITEV